jgi:hypothetical protein
MHDQILKHTRHMIEVAFLPSQRQEWKEALAAYEAGDFLPVAYLLLRDLSDSVEALRQMHWDRAEPTEVTELRQMLEALGFPAPIDATDPTGE